MMWQQTPQPQWGIEPFPLCAVRQQEPKAWLRVTAGYENRPDTNAAALKGKPKPRIAEVVWCPRP